MDSDFDYEVVIRKEQDARIAAVAEVLLVAALSAACLLLLAYPPDRGARRQDRPAQILWQVPSVPSAVDEMGRPPTFLIA